MSTKPPTALLPSTHEVEIEYFWVDADWLRNFKGAVPSHQELMRSYPDAVSRRSVRFSDLLSGRLIREGHASVSHRWMDRDASDKDGVQLRALQEWLLADPKIKWVWLDEWCMPQGKRTSAETSSFLLMLKHVNMLYLGTTVLILLDISSISRFWTQFEAWCSMQRLAPNGLASAVGTVEERHSIRCVHSAESGIDDIRLVRMWAQKTPTEAYTTLSKPDVSVTNQSDKETQLPKILELDKQVKDAFAATVVFAKQL